MPKPRPIRQPMGNPNLPDTGNVVIDLNAAGPEPAARIVYGSSISSIVQSSSGTPSGVVFQHGAINPDIQVSQRSDAISPALAQSTDDDDYDAAAELRKSEERARERARKLEAQNNQTRQWGQEQANKAAAATHALQQSQLDTIETAITAAEAEAEASTSSWADAMAKGDFVTAGREQRKMMSAQNRIETLKAGKDELAVEVHKRPAPAQPPPPLMNNIEVQLANMPNLIESEREWIRNHPDSIEGGENQMRMRTAFLDATKRNLTRGSPEYFAFFNDRMGYEDDGSGEDEEEYVPQPKSRPKTNVAAPRVSAPVVRSGGATLRPGQFMLTEKQREAAKISGIDEVTYARGLQRMMEQKTQGMYGSSEQK